MTSREVDNTSGRWDLHAPGVTALDGSIVKGDLGFQEVHHRKDWLLTAFFRPLLWPRRCSISSACQMIVKFSDFPIAADPDSRRAPNVSSIFLQPL